MLITISREFSSGGRELGKRLSDALAIPCIDNEIIDHIASESGFERDFIIELSEKSIRPYYQGTIAHRFSSAFSYYTQKRLELEAKAFDFIKSVAASGNAVIIGRSADVVLKDYKTFDIFVYSDLDSKIKRFKSRMSGDEKSLSEKEIIKKMKEIDRNRALSRSSLDGAKWGDRKNYDLLINTSDIEIKRIIPGLAEYIKEYFGVKV